MRRGPHSEQRWGILKYLSAEFFSEKSENILGQKTCASGIWGQKLGYDRCPYLSFFVRRLWRWNLWFDWSKRLKYKVNHFWPKMLWMFVMQSWMQDGKDILTETRYHNGIPKFVEKGTRLRLGDNVVSLGKMVVYYCIGLEW